MKANAISLSNIIDLDIDLMTIDSHYGSIDDFREFVSKLHDHGVKVIIDFIPNYTTNKSNWFIKNSMNDSDYKDFYIWSNAPNNWVRHKFFNFSITKFCSATFSFFFNLKVNLNSNESAWQMSLNGLYYLNQINGPDLNYRYMSYRLYTNIVYTYIWNIFYIFFNYILKETQKLLQIFL